MNLSIVMKYVFNNLLVVIYSLITQIGHVLANNSKINQEISKLNITVK